MPDPQTERFVAMAPGLLAELERRATALFETSLAPTPESLPALEQIADFLWRTRDKYDEQDHRVNVLLLGAYVGEIVRRQRGGSWRVDAALGLPLVDLPGGEVFSPMEMVRRRLVEGESMLGESDGADEFSPPP